MGGDQDAPAGMRWLPPARAAEALGISERTLRRHVLAGRRQARHEGRRVLVLVPVPAEPRPDLTRAAPPALAEAVAALAAALAAERGRIARLQARVWELDEARLRLALALARLRPPGGGRPALVPGELRRYLPHPAGGARPNSRGWQRPRPPIE